MATVTLVLGETTFPVAIQVLARACDLFAGQRPRSPYRVQSDAPADVFRSFLAAVSGNNIQITNESASALSRLCEEFGFRGLAPKVAAFRASPEHRIWALEARAARQERALQTLLAAARGRTSVLQARGAQQERRLAALEAKQARLARHRSANRFPRNSSKSGGKDERMRESGKPVHALSASSARACFASPEDARTSAASRACFASSAAPAANTAPAVPKCGLSPRRAASGARAPAAQRAPPMPKSGARGTRGTRRPSARGPESRTLRRAATALKRFRS
jgi:uncharacterized coiled-coil protein SlyX